jgi:hypothetical protein
MPVIEMPIENEPTPIFVIENPPLLPQPIAPEPLASEQVDVEPEVIEPVQEEGQASEELEIVEVPVQQTSVDTEPLQAEPPFLWIGLAALAILLLLVAGWRLIGR